MEVRAKKPTDWRNRIGLYGAYLLGMSGIGFTLPYLPLLLGERGMSDRNIGLVCTAAALLSLGLFPLGLWSDRTGRRKPFIVAALATVALATYFLQDAKDSLWIAALVLFFAENGIGRAVADALTGAEAAAQAGPGRVGVAMGALRFWKPLGIVIVALVGGTLAGSRGVGSVLIPLAIVQTLAVLFALLIRERRPASVLELEVASTEPASVGISDSPETSAPPTRSLRDPALWAFIVAMLLFHTANSPGGVYIGLFLRRTLHAEHHVLARAFAVEMIAWVIFVWPAGWLADRWGRKPLLLLSWVTMTVRMVILGMANSPGIVVAVEVLDGLAAGLFAVLSAAWVTDRLADSRRLGEAQVIVGASLVLGSALGPFLSGFLVEGLGYRKLFFLLAGIGAVATVILALFVPETLQSQSDVRTTTEEFNEEKFAFEAQ